MLQPLGSRPAAAVLTALSTLVLAACGSTTATTSPSSATVAPTSATTAPASTPTTVAPLPASPGASPELAANRLTSAWSTGNRAEAAGVATAAAVATLFALPYPRSNLQFRSCSSGPSPSTCTYRNTASATGELYQLNVIQGPTGWYVQSVVDET